MKDLLLIFVFAVVLVSCNITGGERINGNGHNATEQRQLNNFTGVSVAGSFNIIVSQQPSFAVKIEGDENLLPYVVTTVDDGILKIKTKQGYNLHADRELKIFVGAPQYHSIELSGSGNIETQNTLESDKLSFEMSGSGNINARVNASTVKSDLSGSGNMALSGTTNDFNTSIAGSGNIRCYGLTAETVNVEIAGSGDAEVYASKRLKANIAGSGGVTYKGGATADTHIAGSGGVTKAD